jgi:hypothetical protein
MANLRIKIFYIIIIGLFPTLVLAEGKKMDLGEVAANLMQPVNVFADFIQAGCLLLGTAFIFASIVKYFEHRRSPLMVTMGTVIFLLIAGILLILLPLLALYTEGGVISSLLR